MTTDRRTESIQGFRLSPGQARVWFLQQGASAYRAECLVMIEGRLNGDALKAAVKSAVRRHESLRLTFHLLPGLQVPLQVVSPDASFSWKECESNENDLREQEREIQRWTEAEAGEPIDLGHGPALRATLIKLSPQKFALAICLPALCADARTLSLLVEEISRAYAGGGSDCAKAPIQYIQFSEWQHELLEEQDAHAGRSYWARQDLGALAAMILPFEEQRRKVPFETSATDLNLDRDVVIRIESLARLYDTTVSNWLLACWQVLLFRLMKQPRIIQGYAAEGRKYEELQNSLGLFTKWAPVVTQMDDGCLFTDVVRSVTATVSGAELWQEYFSWETFGGALNVDTPNYFPYAYEFEERPAATVVDGVSFSTYLQEACTERFKLKLNAVKAGRDLTLGFRYDRILFESAAVERVAGHLQALIESVNARPEAPLTTFNLLRDNDRRQALFDFNRTATDYPQNKRIHDLIAERATIAPNRTAVVFENQTLTYAELEAKASQLAQWLHALGVKPEARVAICLEPSIEMIVGILGILKAGAAYVPLDPAYPPDRISFMLEDAHAKVLLIRGEIPEGLIRWGLKVISLDMDWETGSLGPQATFVSPANAENTAYVIYTSGSTGKPKGVQIAHRNLVHSTIVRLIYYHEQVDCFLLLSSFAFDSSLAGIFWTLCQGGTLVLPKEGAQRDIPQLERLIVQHQVSHLLCLPSLYTLLLEHANSQRLNSLRTVIVAGEACPRALPELHHEKLPAVALFNEYGPTEGTVWSSVYKCDVQLAANTVPIGRPIPNMQIFLLDERLEPAPIFLPGEIYLGGEGLARGYLNHPELTAEKFLPHPFSLQAGARLYRTGDQARFLPDGRVEFLGRVDQQVKIRGYRIEPTEIEMTLVSHPSVHEAAVIARTEPEGELRLVAYIVAKLGLQVSISELRQHMQERLPNHMIPSAIIKLGALPLTPNGKVDRLALPAPEAAEKERERELIAPQTQAEEMVARIWSTVLGLEQISTQDNFFDLGGHSFLAIKVHNHLCRELNRSDIPLLKLFEYTTIQSMARFVSDEAQDNSPQPDRGWADRRKKYLRRQQARKER